MAGPGLTSNGCRASDGSESANETHQIEDQTGTHWYRHEEEDGIATTQPTNIFPLPISNVVETQSINAYQRDYKEERTHPSHSEIAVEGASVGVSSSCLAEGSQ